ncbi:hypothetical protein M3Y95_00341100 [Aphelenchoides besseyi]|nr:hypothetical protein M3Y95_00341100 [Aphelenchoides besseyi]
MSIEYGNPKLITLWINNWSYGAKTNNPKVTLQEPEGVCLKVAFTSGFYKDAFDRTVSKDSTLTLEVVDFNELQTVNLQHKSWMVNDDNRVVFFNEEWSDSHLFTPSNPVLSINRNVASDLAFCRMIRFCVQVRSVLEKFTLEVSTPFWQQNLTNLFDNEEYSDAVVKTRGDKSFKVQKSILCCQSDVFKTMFQHDFKEKESNEIKIANADVEVVEAMLRFVYSGKVEKIDELASRLILLADQYQLKDLTTMCMQQLGRDINMSNVIERLELLSFVDHLIAYKEPVFKCLQENYNAVCDTPEWLTFCRTHGKILNEYMAFCSTSK